MFALKALAMSLLTVARAGEWRRDWRITAARAVVAFLPAVGWAWFLAWLGGERIRDAVFPELALWLSVPVAAYLLFGGVFVDHLVARIGALMTWVVHLVWFEIVVAVFALTGFVLSVFGIGSAAAFGSAALLAATFGLLQLTITFGLVRLVPGSFPKAKSWGENVNDIEEAYRKLRGKIEDRKRPDAPRAAVPPPAAPKAEEPRKPAKPKRERLKRSESPPAQLPPPPD